MAKSFKTAKIVKLFIDECKEYLDTLDQDLISMEQGQIDEEMLQRVSRTLHTIKGSSAMVEFMDISEHAHKMEDVLDDVKKRLPDIDGDMLDQIFERADLIKNLVSSIENGSYGTDAAPAATVEQKPAPQPVAPAPPPEPEKIQPAPSVSEVTPQKPASEQAPPADTPPVKKKKGLPDPPDVGRTDMFIITEKEIRSAIDKCYATFAEVESKYLQLDDNVSNSEFYNSLFNSVSYLQKSLVCYGDKLINETLNRLLSLNDAVNAGKAEKNEKLLECIFKGISFVKSTADAKMKLSTSSPIEYEPLLADIRSLLVKVRQEKDYLSIPAAQELFKHLAVDSSIASLFTPYERREIAKSLIDSNNILHIKMKYGLEDLGDLASMSEFFKPLSEEGQFLTSLIIAKGSGQKAESYDFHLFFATQLKYESFLKKYTYLTKIGGIDIAEIELAYEDGEPDEQKTETDSKQIKSDKKARVVKKADAPKSTVRVDTDKLDVLVNLIAELVINHNKLEQETKRMKQGMNLVGDILDSLKFSTKSLGLADRNITLEDLLKPFKAIQADALELGSKKVDSSLLEHMKELREARENLVQLFDMELEKETLNIDMLEKMTSLKIEFDLLYHEFQNDGLNIGRMIEELQEETMKLRMLPISGVFTKFPRRVRDIAKGLGKKVDFLIEGEDTELDKTLIEEIEEPLLHIIRNAVDHGIETEEKRKQKGKDPKGTIWARAYHEGNSVVIEVEDDGKGLDPEMIKKKCIEKRLISADEAEQMLERDILNLIFIPGFSTADKVTDLSGRGVGMDVVKTSIAKLKGSVNVSSKVGQGTIFKLKLPLTLAIIQAMIVKCFGNKFVIPMDPIESTEQVSRYDVRYVEGKEVYQFQDMIIPLIHLRDVYNLKETGERKTSAFPVVILSQAEKKVGLVVEEVVEKQQVVIKTLGDFLGDVTHISGATIFGDGSIAMILDVAGIIQSVPTISRHSALSQNSSERRQEKLILLVDDSLSGRIAQREMLENIGYVVDVASSGMQALSKLGERKFDVIVTDINMPRMDGYEFTQKVRSMPDTSRTPVIMVTSDVKSADRNKAFDVGINEFLAKPFTEEDMKAAIEKHIRVY